MYRCEKDSEVLSILNFLQSKVWNSKQFAYQNVFIWSLFCEKKLEKKEKEQSKDTKKKKPKKQLLCGNKASLCKCC